MSLDYCSSLMDLGGIIQLLPISFCLHKVVGVFGVGFLLFIFFFFHSTISCVCACMPGFMTE